MSYRGNLFKGGGGRHQKPHRRRFRGTVIVKVVHLNTADFRGGAIEQAREVLVTVTGRRIDPVLAIHEIQAAGFELVDFSDLHYRADDELRYEVGRKTVTGNTDRWTLKFRKTD